MVDVASLLGQSRLVTLTGPGGMGKTRLSVQVALGLSAAFPDGVWMVELAPLTDPALLPEAVAAVVPGPQRRPGPCSAEHVASHIADQDLLLVLDNCEHLVAACARLVDVLLRSCPGLRVLATSREPLGVGGEHRWSVAPLSLPEPPADAASVQASEAGELFVRRATATSPSFRLTDAVAPTVAEICRRLDGMPLAIELAAARLGSMAPAEVLERLDDRLHLLTTGSRTVMVRQQTLAAALEWSHDLLSPAEAALLRRVSVFSGWGLKAAEEVCTGDPVERAEVVNHLAGLANKSLVVVESVDDRVRYGLLETIRVWARTKLDAASETAAVARRHAAWCVTLAEQAEEGLGGPHAQVWLERLDAEHDNVRAALEWARATADAQVGGRLAVAMAPFWRTRGHVGEGLGWLEWAVAARDELPVPLRARLLRATGLFRGMLGDVTAALPLLEESSALFVEAGDHDASLCACNVMFHMFKNPRQSLPGLEDKIDRCRRTGDTNKLAHFLWALGQAHFLLGELDAARLHFQECAELGRGEPDGEALRSGLFGLGRTAVVRGEPAVAEAAFQEARSQAEAMTDVDHVATALVQLGDLARTRGDWPQARRLLEESKALTNADGTPVDEARAMYFSGRLAEAESTNGDNGAGNLFAQALASARRSGGLGFHDVRCLLGLGWAAEANGDRSAATGHLLEALATGQAIGDAQATAQALDRLSRLARQDDRFEEADTLARRGLEIHHRLGDVAGIAASLESLGGLALDAGRVQIAARLLAAAQAVLDRAGYARSLPDQARADHDLDQLRAAMGEDELAAAMAEGATLTADEAVAYASRRRGARDRPVSGWESLTPAQREVARMVGEGLTNPEVGRRLFISPRTVGHHLAQIYQKLGIHSRGALIKELAGRDQEADEATA
jgi:predicted ATPase/DNA-binding CsgD family transcriptional regulator